MQLLLGLCKLLLFFFHLLATYFLIAIIGMFWARNGNEYINQSGVPVIVHGDGFHTELYLQIEDSIIHHNWLRFVNDDVITRKHRYNKYINIGWADEDWSIAGATGQLHLLMAFEAVFWPRNKSVMHVQFMDTVHFLKKPFTEKRYLTADGYQNLISFIKEGFVIRNEKPVMKSNQGYYGFDYFYASNRRYHAFNTCNQWTADALNSCSIRNPRFAPFGWGIEYQVRK